MKFSRMRSLFQGPALWTFTGYLFWNWTVPGAETTRPSQNNLIAAEEHFVFACTKWQKNKFAGARSELKKALMLNPSSATTAFWLGAMCEKLGDVAGAKKYFRETVRLIPSESWGYEALGDVLYEEGNIPGAMSNYVACARFGDAFRSYTFKGNRLPSANDAIAYYQVRPINDFIAQWKLGNACWEDNPERSRRCHAEVLRMNTNFAQAYLVQALTDRKDLQITQAVESYSKALAIDPQLKTAWLNRGYLFLGAGSYEKAIKDFSRVIDLCSTDAEAFQKRAIARAFLDDVPGAIKDLTEAARLNADSVTWFQTADDTIAEAVERYERLVDDRPGNAIFHYLLGNVRFSAGGKLSATTEYRKSSRTQTNFALAHFMLSRCDYAMAEPTSGLDHAITLAPAVGAFYLHKARRLTAEKDPDKAIAMYSKAIDLAPRDARESWLVKALLNRADLLFAKKNYSGALADACEASELSRASDSAWLMRGLCYKMMGRNALAIANYTSAIWFNKTNADAYWQRGVLYVDPRDGKNAKSDLREASLLFRQRGDIEKLKAVRLLVAQRWPNDKQLLAATELPPHWSLEDQEDSDAFFNSGPFREGAYGTGRNATGTGRR